MRQEGFTLAAPPLNSHGGSTAKKSSPGTRIPQATQARSCRAFIRTFLDTFCLLKFSGGYFKRQSQFIAFSYLERKPQFVLGVLCIIGCPVELIREVFSRLHSSSSTHIFLALKRLLTFFLTLNL